MPMREGCSPEETPHWWSTHVEWISSTTPATLIRRLFKVHSVLPEIKAQLSQQAACGTVKVSSNFLSVLVSCGCYNKWPQTGYCKMGVLKWQVFIVSQFRRSEILNQDVSWVGSFWELWRRICSMIFLVPLLVDISLQSLPQSSHGLHPSVSNLPLLSSIRQWPLNLGST